MAVTTTKTNKPINPRGNDQSPLAFNRAKLYSGKALDFDGVNDLLTINDGINSLVGSQITLTAWVRLDAVSGYPCIISNKVNDTNGFAFLINPTGNQLFWQYDGAAYQIEAGGALTLGELYFVCATYDGTNLKTYINGVESVTKSAPSKALTATGDLDLYIGRQNTATGYWNGLISGLRAFNVALTAAQVADLYNNPEKIVPTGVSNDALKLWLPMMEGAGTTAYDGSGNALGSEEITNGDFATDSDWTKETGWTISGGKATFDGSATTNALYQNIGGVSGKRYILSFEVTDYVSGSVKAYLSNGDVSGGTPSITANGKYVFDITATGVLCLFRNETSFNGSIDNVSVKELTSYGVINGATWTHGIGAPVSQTSVIDWNKWPLDGSNNALIPQGLTAGRDLLGNLFENVRKQGALNLDGNSWAEVHDNASLDITDEVSLETWYYHDTTTTNEGLLGRWNATTTTYLLLKNDTNVRFYTKSTSAINVNASVSTAGWHHVVGTYDGTTMRIYLDGSESATIGQTGSINTSTFPLEIGRYYSSQTYAQTGAIAQPRIYNRALTAEEVARNYNASKGIYQ